MSHTQLTSVQLLNAAERSVIVGALPGAPLVYIGMPGNAARAYGITDDKVGPFGKPWACLNDPRGWEPAYRDYLWNRIRTDADFALAVRDLHGKSLVCWCKSKGARCHGETLAAAAEWLFHGIERYQPSNCPLCFTVHTEAGSCSENEPEPSCWGYPDCRPGNACPSCWRTGRPAAEFDPYERYGTPEHEALLLAEEHGYPL